MIELIRRPELTYMDLAPIDPERPEYDKYMDYFGLNEENKNDYRGVIGSALAGGYRAAVYCRLSKDDDLQGESASIANKPNTAPSSASLVSESVLVTVICTF